MAQWGPVDLILQFREELKRQLVGKTAHLCKRGVAKKVAWSLLYDGERTGEQWHHQKSIRTLIPNSGNEPELHLLLAPDTFEPLWKSLFRGLDEFFFPKKLPPLKLESKPIPVRDIWGFYNYKKNGALGSTVAHVIVIALIIGGTILGRRMVTKVEAKPQVATKLLDPGDYMLKPAKTQAGGGGGGGDRDVLQASKGRLPKFSMQQITPPAAVIRNPNPKLAVEPTVIVPPDIKVAQLNMPNLGDPKSSAIIPSNGTGSGSGIGSGSGGGVGSGNGAGVGPGSGGGMGGGVFRMGQGVTPPRVIYQTGS